MRKKSEVYKQLINQKELTGVYEKKLENLGKEMESLLMDIKMKETQTSNVQNELYLEMKGKYDTC